MTKSILLCLGILSLTACASLDSERAEELRLKELCDNIETQHLSHCPGNHIPPPPPN